MISAKHGLVWGAVLLTACVCFGAEPAAAAWSHDPFVNNPVSIGTGSTASEAFDTFVDNLGYTYYVRIDPGKFGASVQKLDPAGVPLWGGDLGVTAFVEDLGAQAVACCTDGTGGMFIAVEDGGPLRTDSAIWIQHIDAAGNSLYGESGLNATPGFTPLDTRTYPDITDDGLGGVFVAWQDLPGGDTSADIAGQHISAAGALLWGNVGQILKTSSFILEQPQLASDGTGGFWGLWVDNTVINFNLAPYRGLAHFDSSGTAPTDLRLGSIIFGLEEAVMATDYHGGVVVASILEGFGTVLAYHYDSLLQPQFSAIAATASSGSLQNQVRVAADKQGNCYVAWEDDRDNPDSGFSRPYAQKLDLQGNLLWGTLGVPVDASGFTSAAPQDLDVTVNSNGQPVFVWGEGAAGTTNLYAQQLDAAGTPSWTPRLTVATGPGEQFSPQILPDLSGGVVVAFANRLTTGGDITLKAQRVGPYGNLGTAAPVITSATDSPADQGGLVRLTWQASYLDVPAGPGLEYYTVWNRLPAAKSGRAPVDPAGAAALAQTAGLDLTAATAILADGWTYLGQVPAAYLGQYGYNAPTFADSTGAGEPATEFMTIAHQGSQNWASLPRAGISVDNLAPGAPLLLAAHVAGTTVELNWLPSGANDSDLLEYRIYRSIVPGFRPALGDLVGMASDPIFSEPLASGGTAWLYLVTAVDVHGNESTVSNEAAVQVVSAVGSNQLPNQFAIVGNHPNPFNPTTEIAYDLPRDAAVNLAVYDIAGHRVATLVSGPQSAGRNTVLWNGRNDAGGTAASGVYFARLVAADYRGVWKMILAK